ncbi:MAG: orotate phosphoribosyltransferase [Pseudomonadota bacterium]
MDIATRIRDAARLTGTFTLRSGVVSDTYFDKYLFESDPQLLRSIARALVPLVPQETEVLAGLEMGGIPVVTALSLETDLPAAYIRKVPKTYGTAKFAEGPALAGRNVLLVEDVVSSGGAILDAVAMLRDIDVAAERALCVIDRESGGRENLAAAGLELLALFTMSQIEAAP